jgi:hypothetical protein
MTRAIHSQHETTRLKQHVHLHWGSMQLHPRHHPDNMYTKSTHGPGILHMIKQAVNHSHPCAYHMLLPLTLLCEAGLVFSSRCAVHATPLASRSTAAASCTRRGHAGPVHLKARRAAPQGMAPFSFHLHRNSAPEGRCMCARKNASCTPGLPLIPGRTANQQLLSSRHSPRPQPTAAHRQPALTRLEQTFTPLASTGNHPAANKHLAASTTTTTHTTSLANPTRRPLQVLCS